MGRKLLYVISAAMTVLLMQGCKDPPPAPPPPYTSSVQLTLEDTGVTEAWLKLKFTDSSLPRTFSLQRDGHPTLSGTLVGQDTVLVDTGMAPGASYTCKAFRLIGTARIDSSAPLRITTMDTTSHSISWELDTLGVAFSMLKDIAIVNDTLAYAVGEMYLRDSTGQLDPALYNLAVWNGRSWQIQRVPYIAGGSPYYAPIQWLFASSASDIWFGNSTHWDGHEFRNADIGTSIFFMLGSTRMWADQDGHLYVVGNSGTIAHSSDHGSTWQPIASGTTLDFHDIWGSRNRNGQLEILAVASTFTAQIQESRILQIAGNQATAVSTTGLSPDLAGIWFSPQRAYYAVGAGIHRKRSLSDSAWVVYPPGVVTSAGSWGVRGSGINDVFVAGSFGEVVHFNGVSWRSYFERHHLPTGALGPVAVTEHLVIAVGHLGSNGGAALIGRR